MRTSTGTSKYQCPPRQATSALRLGRHNIREIALSASTLENADRCANSSVTLRRKTPQHQPLGAVRTCHRNHACTIVPGKHQSTQRSKLGNYVFTFADVNIKQCVCVSVLALTTKLNSNPTFDATDGQILERRISLAIRMSKIDQNTARQLPKRGSEKSK